LATGPVLGNAVLHAGSFEVPAGIGPPRRIIDILPLRRMVCQAAPAVEVAPRAPLHALVILSHVQIHRAAFPERPDDLRTTLCKSLGGGEWYWTFIWGVLIGDPDGGVAASRVNRILFANARGHALGPFHVAGVEHVFAVRIALELVSHGVHEQVRAVLVSSGQRIDPEILMRRVGP